MNSAEIKDIIKQKHITELACGFLKQIRPEFMRSLPVFSINPQFTSFQKGKHRIITDYTTNSVNAAMDKSLFGRLVMDTIPSLLKQINSHPTSDKVFILTEYVHAYYRNFPTAVHERALFLIQSEFGTLADFRVALGWLMHRTIFHAPLWGSSLLDHTEKIFTAFFPLLG